MSDYIFLDRIEVTSSVVSVSFGAGGDGVSGSSLNGNEDEVYFINGISINGGSDTSSVGLRLNPNGTGSNQNGQRYRVIDGAESNIQMSRLHLIGQGGDGTILSFEAKFQCASGSGKTKVLNSFANGYHSTLQSMEVFAGGWNDTDTNITSLEIAIHQGVDAISSGSIFTLYKKKVNV